MTHDSIMIKFPFKLSIIITLVSLCPFSYLSKLTELSKVLSPQRDSNIFSNLRESRSRRGKSQAFSPARNDQPHFLRALPRHRSTHLPLSRSRRRQGYGLLGRLRHRRHASGFLAHHHSFRVASRSQFEHPDRFLRRSQYRRHRTFVCYHWKGS
jgi:hypothetical protein